MRHRPREEGASKYGYSRIWKVLLDLLVLLTITRLEMRPGRWFGILSLPFLVLAWGFLAASGFQYLQGEPLRAFPIVYPAAAILFLFAFLHLVLIAVIGELVVWTGDYRQVENLVIREDGDG